MLYLLRRTPVKTLKHLPKFLPTDNDLKNTALISDDEHEKLRLDILDVKISFLLKQQHGDYPTGNVYLIYP